MLTCPLCGSPAEEAQWSRHLPDQDGHDSETTGWDLFCSNPRCPHYHQPIEHDCQLSPEDGCVCTH